MNKDQFYFPKNEIIGLIPAAGSATRISPLPCSKEIFPVGFTNSKNNSERPKVISSYLLECMQTTGITKTFMVIREGKWDIPIYYHKHNMPDIDLAYLVTGETEGTVHTIDHAFSFIKDKTVVFGFPDTFLQPPQVFQKLLQKLYNKEPDIVLGLFKAGNHRKVDMVKIDNHNKVRQIIIKPKKTELTYTWIIAVWTSVFTNFMHNVLKEGLNDSHQSHELYMGDIIQAAIESGLDVDTVVFQDGKYLDIGTKEDLQKAMTSQGLICQTIN